MGIIRYLRNGLPLLVAGLLTLGASVGTGLLLTLGTGDAMAQIGTTPTTPDLPTEDTVFVNDDEVQTEELIGEPPSSCAEPDVDTIQEGVDEASDGDTVVVCEGRYQESVTVDESITVRGAQDTSSDDDERWCVRCRR